MYNISKALNQLKEDIHNWVLAQFNSIKSCFTTLNSYLEIENRTEQDATNLIDEVFYNASK